MGILMWYNKNLQIDEIAERISGNNYSETSRRIMRSMIVNNASMHLIDYKDKQKIESKLHISTQRLLLENIKKTNEN